MSNVTIIPATPREPCKNCGAKCRPEEMKDGLCWKCKENDD